MADVFRKIETARATATLTTSYVASDAIFCRDFDYYTLLIDYLRASVGGGVQWKVEFSLDGTTWYQSAIYDGGTVAVNNDTESAVQREEFVYGSTGAAAERFPYGPIELNQFATYMRVSVVEAGEQVDPGDCGVNVVLTRRKQKMNN